MILRACQFELRFPRPALIMGIVNVTPDSFSDGGQFLKVDAAVEHALQLVEEGAEILDIGGESSRPGAVAVSEEEELRRVLPVLEQLQGRVRCVLSIDTYKPKVARMALARGASLVNDVGANRFDPEMAELIAQSGAGYVAMHMQGTPQSMQVNPRYSDVTQEVREFFGLQLTRLTDAGVGLEQVVLDVGFGFGKRREHNLQLLADLTDFARFGRPLVLGVSRKSSLGMGTSTSVEERLPAALACTCWAVQHRVQIIRTHDVKATVRAVRMWEEIQASLENTGPKGERKSPAQA